MGLVGTRLYDNDGNPYSLTNPLPIQATISTSNIKIATVTATKVPVNTITASNQSILSVGAAITNPILVSKTNAANAANNAIYVEVATNTAQAHSLTAQLDTITADNPMQVSATQSTNTAANPIYIANAAIGATATITVVNASSTAWATIPALANRISTTFQNNDGSVTAFIALANAASPTVTSNVLVLAPNSEYEDRDYSSHWHLRTATAGTAYVNVYQVAS